VAAAARDAARTPRDDAARAADHASIERLADDLVPALIAKLSASSLGEIEIGEDAWTVRVRRPADGTGSTRRPDRGSRGGTAHGIHPSAAFDGHRGGRDGRSGTGTVPASTNGSGPDGADAATRRDPGSADGHRSIATSPAVGVFQPRADLTPGTRVRSGDRLGAVDMLGVPQEVIAPSDGIVGASLAEAGEAVEYGQELIVIELAGRSPDRVTERSEG
jgi:biotin carboxyl carrier protein